MASVIQAADFFVAGGPVQPQRACYVERAGDRALAEALAARRYCCVLGPRAIGKTSLLLRGQRRLRGAGGHAALVSLDQLAGRSTPSDAESWFFALAQSIVRDLRLGVNLAEWWRRKSVPPERRLAAFFWDVLLTHTTGPITIFLDDIERALDLPFAAPLFTALETSYSSRRVESDYGRLAFVLAGVATLRQIWIDPERVTAMKIAAIALGDFTQPEAYSLAAGFGGPASQAQALMDRVCVWTAGHPYLTQKVARGVERKGGRLEDVERVVHEQLLKPPPGGEDPLLAEMRKQLIAPDKRRRELFALLRSAARAGSAPAGQYPAARERLALIGVASVDSSGTLRFRNRVFKEAFGIRFIAAVYPVRWRIFGAMAAVLLIAAGAGAVWYAQYFPAPYFAALGNAGAPLEEHRSAYEELLRWPGFGERATALWAEALRVHSREALTYADTQRIDELLRALPGETAAADALFSEFWLRLAAAAMNAQRRDAALLLAERGLGAAPEGSRAAQSAAALFAELVGEDYRHLERTVELAAPPREWRVDWNGSSVTSLDAAGDLERAALAAGAAAGLPAELTALRHRPLEREIMIDAEGSAGEFTLEIAVGHPAPNELLVTLAAPSGAQASFPMNDDGGSITADDDSPLAPLADENRQGLWRLTIADRRLGNEGAFAGWGLRFETEEASRRDAPAETLAIPEPERTAQIDVRLGANGRYAMTVPGANDASGSLGIWNLEEGRLQAELPLPAGVTRVDLNTPATRVLAASQGAVMLWNAGDGAQVARLETQTGFVLPPVFAADGEYFAIAERIEESPPLYSLLRSEDGAFLTSVEGVEEAFDWLLGPQARYVALRTAPRIVRLLDPRSGQEWLPLTHPSAVARIEPIGAESLLTVDERGDVRAWRLPAQRSAPPTEIFIGTTVDASSLGISADGSRVAYAVGAAVTVRDTATGAVLADLRVDAAVRTGLSPSGADLVTLAGTTLRRWRFADEAIGAPSATAVTALAASGSANDVAVGFRTGELEVRDGSALDGALAGPRLAFFGHRGAVTAAVFDAPRGRVASGGQDGAVRLWDVATGALVEERLRHLEGTTVRALAFGGRRLVSAAGPSARLWRLPEGMLEQALALRGDATAVAAADDESRFAAADDTGRVLIAAVGAAARAIDLDSPVSSLSFSTDSRRLAVGERSGAVVLLDAVAAAPAMEPLRLRRPVQWLAFDEGGDLLAATDHWLHLVRIAGAGMTIEATRLLPFADSADAAIAVADRSSLRVAGRGAGGLEALEIDLRAPPAAARGVPPARDWERALGLRLDETGAPAALR